MSYSNKKVKFDVETCYYADKNSEIDFILQNKTDIIPVEVKGCENKSAPPFKKYIHDNHPVMAIHFFKDVNARAEILQTAHFILFERQKDEFKVIQFIFFETTSR